MKKWLKNLMYIPRHSKAANVNILQLLLPSFAGIMICMACLAGMTWAWFSVGVQTKQQTFTAASFDVSVSIAEKIGGTAPEKSPNGYRLSAGREYTVELTAQGTASTGYCIVQTGGEKYYTSPIKAGETFSFSLTPEEAAEYTFTAVWGSYSGDPTISQGSSLEIRRP